MKHSKLFKSLLLALIATMLPQLASAHDFVVNGIYYLINGNEATVTYRGSNYSQYSNEYIGAVNIPPTVTYNGTTYSVTSIGNEAFYNCKGLTSVTIPNSVTTIGSHAFIYCSGLTSVTIPNSVTSIGNYTFQYCSGLTSVTIGNSVTSIGYRAFCDCTCLTSVDIPNSVIDIGQESFYQCSGLTSVNIGNSVETIGPSAFVYCSGLTSVTIPNSVTSIGKSAFGGCSGLNSVTIGNSVTSIGEIAFNGCSGLTSIEVDNGNTKYDSRDNCNAIIETATNTLIVGCKNTLIPSSVTSIGNFAFSGCTSMTSVTIPNSVTSIGGGAFSHCTGLTSVIIPNSVTTIGDDAFYNCRGLTSVTISNSVISIGNNAFYYCSGLTSVTIPNSVISIGNNAFMYCTCLTSLTLTGQGAWTTKSNMPSISQLKTVTIGSGITSLGNFGFAPDTVNCYAITPPACSSGTFTNYDGELHVPTTSIASYFMADYWQNFNNMVNDLAKVSLDKENADIVLWETLALTATVVPVGDEVLWTSTNPWVATVDENGLVTATGSGECDIYATLASSHDAEYATCHISVSYPEISLSLSYESLEMNMGDEQTLSLTITPDNTGLTPTWSSSDESVAIVDANGKVIAVGEGECDIIATVLDKTATCHVTVTNNVTISLNIENAIIGASQMLTVYPSCTPDVPVELVVTSSDPSVAVARVVNRTNAPSVGLMSFPEKGMALAMMEELTVLSDSKAPAYASEKAIMIVGVQNGTATITVTTADGMAVPAVLELRVADVDGDKVITSGDITDLYNYLLNGDETFIATSDVDGDGYVTSGDITVIYNILLGN